MSEQAPNPAPTIDAQAESAIAASLGGSAGEKVAEKGPTSTPATIVTPPAAQPAKPEDELKILRDRLAKLEGEKSLADEQKKTEFHVENYVRDNKWLSQYPREFVMKFMPHSRDPEILRQGEAKINGFVKDITDLLVKSGALRHVNIGPPASGLPASRSAGGPKIDPLESIAASLKK